VLLVAVIDDAKKILNVANEIKLSYETIWVGSSKWCRFDFWEELNFTLPENPGYFGIIPYTNRDQRPAYFKTFQHRLGYEENNTQLPNYAVEYLVDSILAVAMAFNSTPANQSRNASMVTENMRNLVFEGLSGNVSFTNEGDRSNPKYSILNLQRKNDGTLHWSVVGIVGTTNSSIHFDSSKKLCFSGGFGCNQEQRFPSDEYEMQLDPTYYLFAVVLVITFIMGFMLCRFKQKNKILTAEKTDMEERMNAAQKIDQELLDLDQNLERNLIRKEELIRFRGELLVKPETWSDSNNVLVEVSPKEQQYWQVLEKLQESMSDAYISKLWRVQNKSLWAYYSFHKDRLTMNKIPHNEKLAWHGTSKVDPAVIYRDTQDGYMIQYSRSGLWG
jgi:hypothetical protein